MKDLEILVNKMICILSTLKTFIQIAVIFRKNTIILIIHIIRNFINVRLKIYLMNISIAWDFKF